METDLNGGMPPRFVDLKQEIASSYPDFEQRATKAWNEILGALEEVTKKIAEGGSEVRAFHNGLDGTYVDV